MVPPLLAWASMPSASATASTSSTVARMAWCSAIASARVEPGSAAVFASDAGNRAEHQPPLRPDAPNPAVSASSTTTRIVGSASSR